ncbi:LysR family transcriptional regulator [Yunchengibacter salinarum]|uniref:LysR family transcriptional regulator n=1 Tax=Yunchengibacter salinarum TaxID=3133399 RepID=UPI0035B5DDB5
MSKLDDMAVFIRVVELGSFSRAGRDLRLSAALVSSRIKRLEGALGITLFNRTTRQVRVTEAGRRYYEDCLDILRRVEEAESRLAESDVAPRGILRLTASSSFGRHFLARQIPDFHRRYPHIRVQLQITDRVVDLLAEGLDLAMRMGPVVPGSFRTVILAPVRRGLYASPDYLARRGWPQTPQDLARHDCLMLRYPGSRQFRWRFAGPDGPYDLALDGALDSTNGEVLRDWAVAGEGIVLKTDWEVRRDVAEGRLVEVLADHMPGDNVLHLVIPYDQYVPPRVRVFIADLADRLRADPVLSAHARPRPFLDSSV